MSVWRIAQASPLWRPGRSGASGAQIRRMVRCHWWQALFVLALLGQFLGPLFLAIHIWPFGPIGAGITWLGNTLCPVAWDTPSIFGHPMIVCPLCYGALVSVSATVFTYPRPAWFWNQWQTLPALARYLIIGVLVLPWLSGYVAVKAALWPLSWGGMLVLGLIGGMGVALLGAQFLELNTSAAGGASHAWDHEGRPSRPANPQHK
jgi:hypothetical protein